MGVGGIRKGCEPCNSRVAIDGEVGFPKDVDLIAGHELAECAGFDDGVHSLLGGGERLVRNGSTFRDPRLEFELGVRAEYSLKAGQIRADKKVVVDRPSM